jgi:hypothetical protein
MVMDAARLWWAVPHELFGRVALARLLQEDLIEDEEACLSPVLQARLSEARQWEMLHQLFIDQDAEPQDTIIAWIAQDVTDPQRQALPRRTAPTPLNRDAISVQICYILEKGESTPVERRCILGRVIQPTIPDNTRERVRCRNVYSLLTRSSP